MPVTPFHIIPATTVYFLLFRRLNGIAFFIGTLLIDLEPVCYVFLGLPFPQINLLNGDVARQGFHMITHNPFSIILLVGPALLLLTKSIEPVMRRSALKIFPDIQWMSYSWKTTYLSVLAGTFLHLGWDITLHYDVNLGFPFIDILNPFVNFHAFLLILAISFILIIPAYVVGRRINKGNPFRKLP